MSTSISTKLTRHLSRPWAAKDIESEVSCAPRGQGLGSGAGMPGSLCLGPGSLPRSPADPGPRHPGGCLLGAPGLPAVWHPRSQAASPAAAASVLGSRGSGSFLPGAEVLGPGRRPGLPAASPPAPPARKPPGCASRGSPGPQEHPPVWHPRGPEHGSQPPGASGELRSRR